VLKIGFDDGTFALVIITAMAISVVSIFTE
jgi:hypothetical protein